MDELLVKMIDNLWDDVAAARAALRLAEDRAESWSRLYAKWQDNERSPAAA